MKGKQQHPNNNNNNNKKSKTAKKNQQDDDDDAAADYARRLCHTCRKALHKDVKHTRRLQCQRVARQLKQASSNNNDDDTAKNVQKSKWERRYQKWKQLPLDVVVETALMRLGIPQIITQQQKRKSAADAQAGVHQPNTDAAADSTTTPLLTTTPTVAQDTTATDWSDLVEKLLQHKNMQQSMEKWSQQVADYRKWCLRQEERQQRQEGGEKAKPKSKNSTKTRDVVDTQQPSDYSQSMFLTLGGGDKDIDDEDNGINDEEVDEETYSSTRPAKKNRPGQRARQAKAMAIQAKKDGRQLDRSKSLNWRPKKTDHDETFIKPPQNQKQQPPVTEAPTPAPSTVEELHPSWAARKQQQTGISEFKGKRITFD